jgi:hypothetical protein
MRLGAPIERAADTGGLRPEMPGPPETKLKYALLGSAVSLAVILGNVLLAERRSGQS